MTLRRRLARLEAERSRSRHCSRMVLFQAFVSRKPCGALMESVPCAVVIPRLNLPGVTLWRGDSETESDFRTRVAMTECTNPVGSWVTERDL